MLTRKKLKERAWVVEEASEQEGSETEGSEDGEPTCPVEIAERQLGLVEKKGPGRPCKGPKDCEDCGAEFGDNHGYRDHRRFHSRDKGQKCWIVKPSGEICGHYVITDNTVYFQNELSWKIENRKKLEFLLSWTII